MGFAQHRDDFVAQPLAQVAVFRHDVVNEQGEQAGLADQEKAYRLATYYAKSALSIPSVGKRIYL